jgi:hypothetical protein
MLRLIAWLEKAERASGSRRYWLYVEEVEEMRDRMQTDDPTG